MGFKRLRGVMLPYRKQIYIYAMCLNYREQPKEMQEKIQSLCQSAAGVYADALLALMTQHEKNVEGIALLHHVSPTVLYRCRKRFYELWK